MIFESTRMGFIAAPPIVLPEVLTPTLVLEALEKASGQPVTASVLWGPGIGNLTADEAKQSYSAVRGSAVYAGAPPVHGTALDALPRWPVRCGFCCRPCSSPGWVWMRW